MRASRLAASLYCSATSDIPHPSTGTPAATARPGRTGTLSAARRPGRQVAARTQRPARQTARARRRSRPRTSGRRVGAELGGHRKHGLTSYRATRRSCRPPTGGVEGAAHRPVTSPYAFPGPAASGRAVTGVVGRPVRPSGRRGADSAAKSSAGEHAAWRALRSSGTSPGRASAEPARSRR